MRPRAIQKASVHFPTTPAFIHPTARLASGPIPLTTRGRISHAQSAPVIRSDASSFKPNSIPKGQHLFVPIAPLPPQLPKRNHAFIADTAPTKNSRGELTDEEKGQCVTMWHRIDQRKISGRAAPLRKHLWRYLLANPQCEEYMGQQSDGSGAKRIMIWHKRTRRKMLGNSTPLVRNLRKFLEKNKDCEIYCGQDKAKSIIPLTSNIDSRAQSLGIADILALREIDDAWTLADHGLPIEQDQCPHTQTSCTACNTPISPGEDQDHLLWLMNENGANADDDDVHGSIPLPRRAISPSHLLPKTPVDQFDRNDGAPPRQ